MNWKDKFKKAARRTAKDRRFHKSLKQASKEDGGGKVAGAIGGAVAGGAVGGPPGAALGFLAGLAAGAYSDAN